MNIPKLRFLMNELQMIDKQYVDERMDQLLNDDYDEKYAFEICITEIMMRESEYLGRLRWVKETINTGIMDDMDGLYKEKTTGPVLAFSKDE